MSHLMRAACDATKDSVLEASWGLTGAFSVHQAGECTQAAL